MPTLPSPLLEANLDRVLDGVLRTLRSGKRDVDIAADLPTVTQQAEQTRSTLRDDASDELLTTLCGRVAEALRGMELAPGSGSDYRATSSSSDHPATLDIRR